MAHTVAAALPTLAALRPLAGRMAMAYLSRLPPSVSADDIRQEAEIAAWRAYESFDGRGVLEGYVAKRIKWALVDFVRADAPGAVLVSDGAIEEHASAANHAEDIERQQYFQEQMRGLPERLRPVVEMSLAGATNVEIARARGVHKTRVQQWLEEAKTFLRTPSRKLSERFQPSVVPISYGHRVPCSDAYFQTVAALALRMKPTASVLLGTVAAELLYEHFEKTGVRASIRHVSSTTAKVWREPSQEQLKGLKND